MLRGGGGCGCGCALLGCGCGGDAAWRRGGVAAWRRGGAAAAAWRSSTLLGSRPTPLDNSMLAESLRARSSSFESNRQSIVSLDRSHGNRKKPRIRRDFATSRAAIRSPTKILSRGPISSRMQRWEKQIGTKGTNRYPHPIIRPELHARTPEPKLPSSLTSLAVPRYHTPRIS